MPEKDNYKRHRYKYKPEYPTLDNFLDKHLEEQIEKTENELINKSLKKEYREHREDGLPNTYAPIRHEEDKKQVKAFLVTFREESDIFYIGFGTDKYKACYQASKYFKENFHPAFMKSGSNDIKFVKSRFKRIPEFDKYAKTGRVPIPELMKFGVSLPCSCCGNDNFTYEDYEMGRCFVFEGEGNMLPYADGFVLCYNCYQKIK